MYPVQADYSSSILECEDELCKLNNAAPGADKLRWSFDYGTSWSDWQAYVDVLTVPWEAPRSTTAWKGIHVMVQYWSSLVSSAQVVVHGDSNYNGPERRNPQFLARGAFNSWGLDKGLTMNLENNGLDDGWTLAVRIHMQDLQNLLLIFTCVLLIALTAHDTMASKYTAECFRL